MKSILTLFLFTQVTLSYGQISKKIIFKSDSLKYKTVQVSINGSFSIPSQQFLLTNLIYTFNERGSAFFIKYKKKYFLITNYHVVTGRTWEYTSLFVIPYLQTEFNEMQVTFYSKNKDGYENITIPLHDANDNRTFYSLPVNTDTKRVILDVALIELDTLPGQTIITPIDLSKSNKKWQLNPNTQLFCYGYSKRTWSDLYPFCDTITTVGDSIFYYYDHYISVYNPPNMHGSSGSPVYYKRNNKYELAGIFFSVVPPEWRDRYNDLFPRTYYTNPIGFIITVNYLKESLDVLFNNERLRVSGSP